MGTKHETTALSADDFRRIAMQLEYFSKRYRDLIRQMEESSVYAAHVTGVKTLDRAIEYLQGAVTSATAAVDDAVIQSTTRSTNSGSVTRQFYLSSARSLKLLDMQVARLAFYDPTTERPLRYFGPLWTDSRADDTQVREVIRNVHKMLDARPDLTLSVGLFPYSIGVADANSRSRAS